MVIKTGEDRRLHAVRDRKPDLDRVGERAAHGEDGQRESGNGVSL